VEDGMKPIETIYKGYRFRSRLEARWAVYFDAIGIVWEYEKEGYKFKNRIKYLPDFWLPQVNMWAEVKPNCFDEQELEKVELLVRETCYSCILLDGMPDKRSYGVVVFQDDELVVGGPGDCDCVISMYHGYPVGEGRFYSWTGGVDAHDFGPRGMFEDVTAAVEKARSARFEYGERGA
jgi:hypothetical protein